VVTSYPEVQDSRCGAEAAVAVPTAAAGVLRPEAEEETGAVDTGAAAEAALGETEL
jgi:uncharacterized Ntn-hydrolase superfamily protein